jgi:hypothetical protein
MKALVISKLCSGSCVIESLLRRPDITSVHFYDSKDFYKGLNPRVKYLGIYHPISLVAPNIYHIVIDTTSIPNRKARPNIFASAQIKVGSIFDVRWVSTESDKYDFKQYCKNRGVRVPEDKFVGSIPDAEAFLSTSSDTLVIKQEYSNSPQAYPVISKGFKKLPWVDTPVFIEAYHEFDHYVHVSYLMKEGRYHIFTSQYLEKSDRYIKGFSFTKELDHVPQEISSACEKLLPPLARDFKDYPDKLGTLQFGHSEGLYYLLENQARLNCMGVHSIPDIIQFVLNPDSYSIKDTKHLYTTKSYYLEKEATLDLSQFPRDSYQIASYEPQINDRNKDGIYTCKSSRFLVMFMKPELKLKIDEHILRQSVDPD